MRITSVAFLAASLMLLCADAVSAHDQFLDCRRIRHSGGGPVTVPDFPVVGLTIGDLAFRLDPPIVWGTIQQTTAERIVLEDSIEHDARIGRFKVVGFLERRKLVLTVGYYGLDGHPISEAQYQCALLHPT